MLPQWPKFLSKILRTRYVIYVLICAKTLDFIQLSQLSQSCGILHTIVQ